MKNERELWMLNVSWMFQFSHKARKDLNECDENERNSLTTKALRSAVRSSSSSHMLMMLLVEKDEMHSRIWWWETIKQPQILRHCKIQILNLLFIDENLIAETFNCRLLNKLNDSHFSRVVFSQGKMENSYSHSAMSQLLLLSWRSLISINL